MREYNSAINNVFSVQLFLACREFVSKLLNCVFQFSSVISVFFYYYFRISRLLMLRSKNELNN